MAEPKDAPAVFKALEIFINHVPMRCDHCKHWAKIAAEWEAGEAGFRKCEAIRQRWDIQDDASSALAKAEFGDNPSAEYEIDDAADRFIAARCNAIKQERAYVQDASQYSATFYTGPDFFCARFEPKEDAGG